MDRQEKDQALWIIAKKRAAFKWSFVCYVVINTFLVGVWYFTDTSYFWPAWCIMGWGIGVSIQYFDAYHGSTAFSAEREYEKLKNENR